MPKFTLVMSKEADEVLAEIGKKTEATKSEVVRSALALYQVLFEEAVNGRRLYLKGSTQTHYTEVVMPMFNVVYNREQREKFLAPVIPITKGKTKSKPASETQYCRVCESSTCEHIYK